LIASRDLHRLHADPGARSHLCQLLRAFGVWPQAAGRHIPVGSRARAIGVAAHRRQVGQCKVQTTRCQAGECKVLEPRFP